MHRDLRPANVLLMSDLTPKIAAFAGAGPLQPAASGAPGGSGGGSGGGDEGAAAPPRFAPGRWLFQPPEVLRGEASELSADVWSFGCLLCCLSRQVTACPRTPQLPPAAPSAPLPAAARARRPAAAATRSPLPKRASCTGAKSRTMCPARRRPPFCPSLESSRRLCQALGAALWAARNSHLLLINPLGACWFRWLIIKSPEFAPLLHARGPFTTPGRT